MEDVLLQKLLLNALAPRLLLPNFQSLGYGRVVKSSQIVTNLLMGLFDHVLTIFSD